MDEKVITQFEAAYPCSARSDWIRNRGKYFCGHPRVHSKDQVVSMHQCATCRFRTGQKVDGLRPFPTLNQVDRTGLCFYLGDLLREKECSSCRGNVRIKTFACLHPEHSETTIKDCDFCQHYEQRMSVGNGPGRPVRHWAVGVTTALRKIPTLHDTIASIESAGWEEMYVFAEPGSPTQGLSARVKVIPRRETLGAWPNWLASLAELYLRQPKADAFVMFQDDIRLCTGVRAYLEHTLWPEPRLGFISLYCPSNYQGLGPYLRPNGASGFTGALALVLPPAAVRSLLSSPTIWAHNLRVGQGGMSGIDTAIGYWSSQRDLDGLFHYPSLVEHTGETSTIWPNAANAGRRQTSSFVGPTFDANALISGTAHNATSNPTPRTQGLIQ